MRFQYQNLKTLSYHGFNPGLSKRLLTFLAYDGDLFSWALKRWSEQYTLYHTTK